jgi:light-regulated signal transduction histidine kinase (bacteriophytochrome)
LTMPHRIMNPSGIQSNVSLTPRGARTFAPVTISLGKHVICNDFVSDPRTAPWHERGKRYGWAASAAFPLFRAGQSCGALNIYSAYKGFFGVDEIRLLDELAANISFLLDQIDIRLRKNDLEERLKKSLDNLVAANIELERFSEIYSHHLQEPVRNVVSFCQMLERRLGEKLDGDSKEILRTIVDAAMKIRQLNLDLLEFSRSRHSQTSLGSADAASALQYACGELQTSMKQAGAEIRIKPLPEVLGNEAELRQLFLNLLSNAIKFAAPNRPAVIEVEAREEDNGWHFTVRDNGIGIEEPYLEKVFEVFSRLHVQAEYPGTGTGLAIARRIIERHDGKIWINSQVGIGTTVHFWLHRAKGGDVSPAL